jgi:flavin-dependent dehydrogenase
MEQIMMPPDTPASGGCQPTGFPCVSDQTVSLPGTISLSAAAATTWDVIVMGAGVAGSLAARELARSGLRVLLVEKRNLPRPKVCGACLNGAALEILARVGLSAEIDALDGPVLTQFALRRGTSHLRLPLPAGRAISRELLDLTLARAAIAAGAEFLPETTATVMADQGQNRTIDLVQHGGKVSVQTRTVVVASGLGPQGLPAGVDWTTKVGSASRVGAGCSLSEIKGTYAAGTIWMAVGDGGYVGLVRVEDDRLNIAAAFDLDFLRRHGSPGMAASHLLRGAGYEVPAQLLDATWHGTVSLTRQTSPVASRGIFLIGDAAGYVEPFTGEGMAWGLATGLHVVPWVRRAVTEWSVAVDRGWIREHHLLVRRRQNVCRVLTGLLRCPRLLRGGMFLFERWPGLLSRVVARFNITLL